MSAPRTTPLAALLSPVLALAWVAACSLNLSFKDRPCPQDGRCGEGLVCVPDEEGGRFCREAPGTGGGGGGGSADAGGDAGPGPDDGGGMDADAGDVDAGPLACGSVVCAPWQFCFEDACYERTCTNVPCDGGRCEKGTCFPLDCGTPRCADGALCAAGACVHPECAFVSCQADAVCVRGQCRSRTTCFSDGGQCPSGQWCEGSQCIDTYCQGLACPQGSVCQRGACVVPAATERDCGNGVDDDGDQAVDCLDPDCAQRLCNDGNQCTSPDVCVADGGCEGPVNAGACVSPPGDCFERLGTCNVDAGTCSYAVRTGPDLCSDGVACTLNDVCLADAGCAGTPAVDAGSTPCTRRVCNIGTGNMDEVVNVGLACDAGLCFPGGTCQASGACVGSVKTCAPTVSTCRVTQCNPTSGACEEVVAPMGTACNLTACRVSDCLANGNCNGSGGVSRPDGFDAGSSGQLRCCGGVEVNVTSSSQHCGGCNLACASGEGCQACGNTGTCTCGPSSGFSCANGQSCTGTMGGNLCLPDTPQDCAPGQALSMQRCIAVEVPVCSYP